MKKHIMPATIRGKIILCTATITLFIVAATVSICFTVFQAFSLRNQIQSTEYNLQIVSNNVAASMADVIYFSNWCHSNSDISRYLEAFKDLPRMPSIGSDQAALRITALNTHDRLKEEYHYTPAHAANYITRVVISPDNCRNFLQISATSAATTMEVAEMIRDADFFKPLYEAPDYLWLGFREPLYQSSTIEWILPVVRPIKNRYDSGTSGWVYLAVSDRVIRDYLTAFPLSSDSSLTITIGEKNYLLSDNHFVETTLDHTVLSDLSKDALNPDTKAQLIQLADGTRRRLVTCPLGGNGWTISLLLSEQDYSTQTQAYLLIILGIGIVIILMGFLLALLLNRTISQPVNRLSDRIHCISEGDFSRDETIEGSDELGHIGQGINYMSENVQLLMERRVADEKQKKDLEYQILQSQINPHFLYNTLNSIKWMATIQNAPGIAEMTTSLARLMKNVAKGTAAQIPLKEELALVNDYVLILKYRYGGNLTVTYDIADEALNDCLIHRFSLQPLVENALFHGIEPKGCPGLINIAAKRTVNARGDDLLQISVTDNGVGMDEETIKQVLQEGGKTSADFFKQLGIHNVHTRIQYAFGPDYGVTIHSKIGEYTTMMLQLPLHSAEHREGDFPLQLSKGEQA